MCEGLGHHPLGPSPTFLFLSLSLTPTSLDFRFWTQLHLRLPPDSPLCKVTEGVPSSVSGPEAGGWGPRSLNHYPVHSTTVGSRRGRPLGPPSPRPLISPSGRNNGRVGEIPHPFPSVEETQSPSECLPSSERVSGRRVVPDLTSL